MKDRDLDALLRERGLARDEVRWIGTFTVFAEDGTPVEQVYTPPAPLSDEDKAGLRKAFDAWQQSNGGLFYHDLPVRSVKAEWAETAPKSTAIALLREEMESYKEKGKLEVACAFLAVIRKLEK